MLTHSIYAHIKIHVHIYTYITHTYIHAYTHIYIYIHICIHTYIYCYIIVVVMKGILVNKKIMVTNNVFYILYFNHNSREGTILCGGWRQKLVKNKFNYNNSIYINYNSNNNNILTG